MVVQNTRIRSTQQRKNFGSVETPRPVAAVLTEWAIKDPRAVVLDIGSGEGVFLVEAFKRLIALGADPDKAVGQLLGVELDAVAIERFRWRWMAEVGGPFPRVEHGNLFSFEFTPVDAIIGNPPYVSRVRLQENVESVRARAAEVINSDQKLRRLSDLYIYFLLYATKFLKPGGHLAVVLSSSWLDVGYGVTLKQYLTQNFEIRAIVGFERRLFADALVKSVFLLAQKAEMPKELGRNQVRFIHVKNFSPTYITEALGDDNKVASSHTLRVYAEHQSHLDPGLPWGIYFKAPGIYRMLTEKNIMTTLGKVACTRIGLQTLAKSFYILDRERLEQFKIEPQYYRPLVLSPREVSSPVVSQETGYFVFYCDADKEQLEGTHALRYIEWGEQQPVRIRHKTQVVQGYHNQERIKQAKRVPWYNIKTEIDRRGCFPILIPRRIYESYKVFWNKWKLIPNEDFIEVRPLTPNHLIPMLAVLNSSFGELMFRMHAQVYGGGVFNLNPGDMRRIPTIDLTKLDLGTFRKLAVAYTHFLKDEQSGRQLIDQIVGDVLGLSTQLRNSLDDAVQNLKDLARQSKGCC